MTVMQFSRNVFRGSTRLSVIEVGDMCSLMERTEPDLISLKNLQVCKGTVRR